VPAITKVSTITKVPADASIWVQNGLPKRGPKTAFTFLCHLSVIQSALFPCESHSLVVRFSSIQQKEPNGEKLAPSPGTTKLFSPTKLSPRQFMILDNSDTRGDSSSTDASRKIEGTVTVLTLILLPNSPSVTSAYFPCAYSFAGTRLH